LEFCLARAPFATSQPAGLLLGLVLGLVDGKCCSLQTWRQHILHCPGNSHHDSPPIFGSLQMRFVVCFLGCLRGIARDSLTWDAVEAFFLLEVLKEFARGALLYFVDEALYSVPG